MKLFLIAVILIIGLRLDFHSAYAGYQPLGTWADGKITAFDQWDSVRQMTSAPTADGNRPVLPGVSGRNLELLQDAVARKYHRVTQGKQLPIARRVLADTSKSSLPKLRGYMAEAIFLDKNPDYGYIGKTNGSQHDVYMKNPSGGPGIITGQVKFVMDGNPKTYANHMVKDHRSKHFFVPDDHVDSLRAYLKQKADRLCQEGKLEEAKKLYRDMNRVKPIGATSAQIDSATRQALREARFIRIAPYVFLGIAAIMTVGPAALEWYRGEISNTEALYKIGKGGSTLVVGVVADRALVIYRGGILRGTLRGNVLTAVAVLLVDTSWQVYEHGGVSNAIHNPDFLIRCGGGVGATTCALIGGTLGAEGGTVVGTSVGGPLGGMIGGIVGGIIVGTGSGMIGYFGGQEGTKWVLRKFAPEKLYEQENRAIEAVLETITQNIEEAKKF